MDSILLDSLTASSISGLVIEALGAGNLPPTILPAIKKLLDQKIPIILVSRCFNGIAEPVYAYQGGGIQLEKDGILFVKELNAQKPDSNSLSLSMQAWKSKAWQITSKVNR